MHYKLQKQGTIASAKLYYKIPMNTCCAVNFQMFVFCDAATEFLRHEIQVSSVFLTGSN